jgi:hypothetical protein
MHLDKQLHVESEGRSLHRDVELIDSCVIPGVIAQNYMVALHKDYIIILYVVKEMNLQSHKQRQ